MLTIKQINDVSFRKSSFSGYKPEDVDNFIDEVTETVTALLNENQSYKERNQELTEKNANYKQKIVALAGKIDTYRKDEENIKEALLAAQKLSATAVKDAKRKALVILDEANAEAESIINAAKGKSKDVVDEYEGQIEVKKLELEQLKTEVSEFRETLFALYREHLTMIEQLPIIPEEERVQIPVEQVVPETPVETAVSEVTEPVAEEVPSSIDDIINEISEEVAPVESAPVPEDTNEDDDEITKAFDFNAYADIPEELKKEKESLYSTLEFGDGINI